LYLNGINYFVAVFNYFSVSESKPLLITSHPKKDHKNQQTQLRTNISCATIIIENRC
jgi:hypothetical protein